MSAESLCVSLYVCVHASACMHAHVCALLVGPWWSVLGERVVPVAWTNVWEMRYRTAFTLSSGTGPCSVVPVNCQ